MPELPFVLFMVFFVIATFRKEPWALLLKIIALAVVLGLIFVPFWNSSKRDFVLLYMSFAACIVGMETGFLVNLIRIGLPQFSFDRANSYRGLSIAMAIFWLMYGAGALGYAWASNAAVSYAQGEGAWTLYNKGNESVAAAIFFLSMGISGLVAYSVKSALTKRGVRFALGYFVEWEQVESYTWQDHKLTVCLKASLLPHWLRRHSVIVKPADRNEIDRLMVQYLPGKQVQPAPHVQTPA